VQCLPVFVHGSTADVSDDPFLDKDDTLLVKRPIKISEMDFLGK